MLLHFPHRLLRDCTGGLCAIGQRVQNAIRLIRQQLRAFTNGRQLRHHPRQQHLFAIDAAPAGRAALLVNVLDGFGRIERLVHLEDVAHFRTTRIAFADALRIGHRGPQLGPHLVFGFQQSNGVAQ